MIKSKISLLLALFVTGCDNQNLVDNIDTFTCSIIPWYVADCSSPAIQEKALSIVQNGLAEAHIQCYGTNTYGTPAMKVHYEATLLHDGSVIANASSTGFNGPTFSAPRHASSFSPRGSQRASEFGADTVWDSSYILRTSLRDGYVESYLRDAVNPSYEWHCGPLNGCRYPIEGNCTGFNLGSFSP